MDNKKPSVTTSVVIPADVKEKMQYLSQATRITQSEYIREALEDLLNKYAEVFKGSPFDKSSKKAGQKGKTKRRK